MFDSFRSRLVLSNLVITLVGLLVVIVVFTGVLANRSRQIKEKDLATQSRLVARQVEYLYRHESKTSKQDLQLLVAESSKALQVRVILVDPYGTPRLDSKRMTPYATGSWHLDRAALEEARSASNELRSGTLFVSQSPIQGTVRPNGGAVLLVANVTDVEPTISSLLDVILIVLGTALLVWLAIGLYFTFSISRPLVRITAATARMARGDYDARVPTRGDGEIARLATSFNEMAAQVQRANRVLRDFVANVSHDLRTPLTMITGFSQALVDGTAREGEVEESARLIHEESTKMQRIVDDLLQLTRLESGLLTFHRESLETRLFVQNVIARVLRVHGETEMAQIKNLVPAGTPSILADPTHMERALFNLLDNALEYTPAGGEVAVRASPIGNGWVQMSVTDTGKGIARADVERVFERFYRSDKSRERRHGHSGLGLAIVREIVEAHGGSIDVESEPGRGTTFRFTVPAAPSAALHRGLARAAEGVGEPVA